MFIEIPYKNKNTQFVLFRKYKMWFTGSKLLPYCSENRLWFFEEKLGEYWLGEITVLTPLNLMYRVNITNSYLKGAVVSIVQRVQKQDRISAQKTKKQSKFTRAASKVIVA